MAEYELPVQTLPTGPSPLMSLNAAARAIRQCYVLQQRGEFTGGPRIPQLVQLCPGPHDDRSTAAGAGDLFQNSIRGDSHLAGSAAILFHVIMVVTGCTVYTASGFGRSLICSINSPTPDTFRTFRARCGISNDANDFWKYSTLPKILPR